VTERDPAAPPLATFWHGPLDALTYACLASFAHFGARLRVYAYDRELATPPGVERADARLICPDETLPHRYYAGGKPSIATFADMFRYRMIRETGCCWVDSDMVCLRTPDFAGELIVLARQPPFRGEAVVNNAVLKLPPDDPTLNEILARAESAADIDQPWGAIGPFLLTEIAERNGVARFARTFEDFYPIEPDHFWKPFLPAYREEVEAATRASTMLHLWSELIARSGYDRSIGPPEGSFLYAAFQRQGALDRFAGFYDARTLETQFSLSRPRGERAG
jgi:hypothetical protein